MSFLPKSLQEKYFEILKEHHENKTEEAKIFKQIDRLEMVMQALEYEKDGYDKNKLDEFWSYVEKSIDDSDLKKIFEIMKKERLKQKSN